MYKRQGPAGWVILASISLLNYSCFSVQYFETCWWQWWQRWRWWWQRSWRMLQEMSWTLTHDLIITDLIWLCEVSVQTVNIIIYCRHRTDACWCTEFSDGRLDSHRPLKHMSMTVSLSTSCWVWTWVTRPTLLGFIFLWNYRCNRLSNVSILQVLLNLHTTDCEKKRKEEKKSIYIAPLYSV